MSPIQFPEYQHAKRKINGNNGMSPSPLKINKDSHFIKKSSPPPSSSSSSSTSSMATGVTTAAASAKPPQRHPVIIYTHSPKVIHTHPRDFMALVQKLTGLSRSEQEPGGNSPAEELNKNRKAAATNDENESSSVITNCNGTVLGNVQINSCFATPPPIFDPPNACFSNIPLFTPNSSDFLCPTQTFYNNYAESLLWLPNVRSSISSSSNLEGMKEFREY